MQKIKPVMIRFHCPPSLTSSGQVPGILLPTQSNWLLRHAAWFVLQVYRGASKRVLPIGGDTGAHGWRPLCPQRSFPQHDFLYNILLLKIFAVTPLVPQKKLKSLSSFQDRSNMQPEMAWSCLLCRSCDLPDHLDLLSAVPEVPQLHSRGWVHTVSSADLILSSYTNTLRCPTHARTQRSHLGQLL